MPFGSFETTLCAIGLGSVASARYFYNTKQTLPFKLAYVASVMTLGSGVTLGAMPDTDALVKRMEAEGVLNRQREQQAHELSKAQMQALREAAGRQ